MQAPRRPLRAHRAVRPAPGLAAGPEHGLEASRGRRRNHAEEWARRKTRWKQQVRERRQNLIRALGGKCTRVKGKRGGLCGRKKKLQFHHLVNRAWNTRDLNQMQRMRLYEREAARGLIALRCPTCNKKEGRPGEPTEPDPDFYSPEDF